MQAFDLENNIEVACKIHELNSSWSNTLRDCYIKHAIRENDIYKQIKHSKVVNHYDTFEIDQNSFCSVLEICSGPDLYTYLKLHKVIPEKEAKFIITQLLSALKYLNERDNKIIHFDLKPQNILFHNGEVKIADFGLAKVLDDHKDQIELTSQGVGTYWYVPPECFETDKNKPIIDSKVRNFLNLGRYMVNRCHFLRAFVRAEAIWKRYDSRKNLPGKHHKKS